MTQKISMEEAFPTFQKRCTELFEENLILRAQVDVLERQLSAATEENTQLKDDGQTTAGTDHLPPVTTLEQRGSDPSA